MSENRVIGRGPDIPWRLPDEQTAVRRLTMGHCLIMGRKTWQAIGRPLPGRTSIVVTRDRDFEAGFDEVIVVHDFEAAVEAARAKGDDEAFVFGGEAIYAAALPRADCLYLTRVHATVEGDAHFPDFDPAEWKLRDEAHHPPDDRNQHAFTTQRYERA